MPGHRAFDAGPDGVNKRPIRHSEDSMGADSGRSCGRLRLRSDSLWRLPMSLDPHEEPAAIQTHIGAIFISLELSRSKWLITSLVPGGGQKMSKHWVDAGDLAGLLARFWSIRDKASARMGISYPIIVIQEAGLDGFWIHRALVKEGIERATWWTRPRSRFRGVADAPRPTRSMARGCSAGDAGLQAGRAAGVFDGAGSHAAGRGPPPDLSRAQDADR